MAKAVSAINKAVVEAGPGELLVVLKSPAPALRSLTDECAESYQSKLREAGEEKRARGEWWSCLHRWGIVQGAMYVRKYVRTYLHMHVCMCVCMYVCMYVRM